MTKPTKRQVRLCMAGLGVLIAAVALAKAVSDLRERMAQAEAGLAWQQVRHQ